MFYSKNVSVSNQLQYQLEFVFKNRSRCKSPNITIINDYSGYKSSSGENATQYCLAKPWIWIFTSVRRSVGQQSTIQRIRRFIKNRLTTYQTSNYTIQVNTEKTAILVSRCRFVVTVRSVTSPDMRTCCDPQYSHVSTYLSPVSFQYSPSTQGSLEFR
ncbi:hypothetical protein Zmor_003733 [Zophobas morio]|uniref:Uncharacterized protein n=1 Tax=Zophobas morio TaxID=2755281 RepID=A0AA38HNE9_9CUCU|nr:hypothetical protein Zmor_003733 [Zophobas morio]